MRYRWGASCGVLALVAACGREPRAPLATAAPLDVPPIPVSAPAKPTVPLNACDDRDPTPDAMPATPAPAAFTKLDAEIRQMQSVPGKYVYTGAIADVVGDGKGKKGAYANDAEEAKALAERLEREVVDKNESPEWAVVARTREAEMFERLRGGLATVAVHQGPGPPPSGHVALFTTEQLKMLQQMMNAGHPHFSTKVTELQAAAVDMWNKKKQQELDEADARILDCYARAAHFAPTKNPAATRAVRRLARYTIDFGNERMAKLLGRGYVPNMYRQACAELTP